MSEPCLNCTHESMTIVCKNESIVYQGKLYNVPAEFLKCALCGNERDAFGLIDPLENVYKQASEEGFPRWMTTHYQSGAFRAEISRLRGENSKLRKKNKDLRKLVKMANEW